MAKKIIENENTIKKISNKHGIRNFTKILGVTAMTAAMFAMSAMINIIMWIVRIAIITIGGIPGLIKIVQGQQEENPRDRNNGVVSAIVVNIYVHYISGKIPFT